MGPGENEVFLSKLPPNLGKFMPPNLVETEPEDTAQVKQNKGDEKNISVESFLDIGVPVERLNGDVGISVKRTDNDNTTGVSQTDSTDLHYLNKKRKNDASSSTLSLNSQKISVSKDALSNIHSIEELKSFLIKETSERKVSRKTCYSGSVNQESWKALKKEVLSNINEKTPNKSLKICRKILRNSVKI